MGTSVSAIRLEKITAVATVMPNSPNKRPMLPPMKDRGTNTATSTSVVAMTAKPISRLPSRQANSVG